MSSSTLAAHGTRDPGDQPGSRESPFISGSPTVSATISGVNATAHASSALSSTGISMHHPAQALGRGGGDFQRGVGAERRPADDGLVELEVVEQRHDVAGEEPIPYRDMSGGPVGAAVPERSSVTTRLPRAASARASGTCIRWLESRPCSSTVTRVPSPYSR